MSGIVHGIGVPAQRAPQHAPAMEPAPAPEPARGHGRRPTWAGPLLREVAFITVLFVLYNAGRVLAAQRVSGAFDSAEWLWRAERWLQLPSELTLQALVLDAPAIVRAANGYYASVHFPLTFLVLLWLFLRRPDHYPWARRALVVASAAALVVQVLVPMAPPRMLTDLGFVDTGLAYGQSVYGAVADDALSNQFAAMPSLHVGWAVLVAVVLVRTGRSRRRWLWVLHPVVTLLVVVVTANHYWLDGVVGAGLVLLALRLTAVRSPSLEPARPASHAARAVRTSAAALGHTTRPHRGPLAAGWARVTSVPVADRAPTALPRVLTAWSCAATSPVRAGCFSRR